MTSPRRETAESGADHPLMSAARRAVSVGPDADAFTALSIMQSNEVRHLPVVLGDRCVGLLTEADLLRALASASDPAELTVDLLCHHPAPAVPAGSSLRTMARRMLDDGADAAVVVSRGAVVGLVTSTDVLGAVTTRRRTPAGAVPSPR